VPPAFGWRTPELAAVLVIHVPPPCASFDEPALGPELTRSRLALGTAEVFITLAVDATGEQARAQLAELRAFAARELAPSLRFDTPTSYLEELRAGGHFKPALWEARAGIDLGPSRLAPLALRSANRRAEVELETAARAGAFAQQDGLLFLDGAHAELASTLGANLRDDDAAALSSSRAVAESARARSLESVGVLARSAQTSGKGEALLVFNPLPFERIGLVELEGTNEGVLDAEGHALFVQRTLAGRCAFLALVPALGHAVFHQLAAPGAAAQPAPPAATRAGWSFESSRLALRLDPQTGAIASLRLLPQGTELLGAAGDTLAWLPAGAASATAMPSAAPALDVLEDGPVRLVLRRTREIAGGHVTEDLILERDRPELLVRCRAEGLHEPGTLLARFTLRAAAQTVVFDTGGASSALDPAQRDPLALVSMRRYVAAYDGEAGLALLSADGASFACGGDELSIEVAQGGELSGGECSYALRPLQAGAGPVGCGAAADDLAYPLITVQAGSHGGLRAPRHVYLELSRRAQDGGLASGARSGIELVALRPCRDGCELELRERLGERGELLVQPARGLFGAEELDLRTGAGRALACERGVLRSVLEAWSARRIRLRLRP
jgi:hypothetical protein